VKRSTLASLGWSPIRQALTVGGALVVVIVLLAIIWRTTPQTVDDAPRVVSTVPTPPVSRSAPRSVAAPIAAPDVRTEAAGPAPDGDEPFLDGPRVSVDGDSQVLVDHFRAGRAAADSYHWTRAIDEYGAAARLAPADAAAQYDLALAFHRRGDERDAIATFRTAIALSPDEAEFHLPLAAAYEKLGQSADAVREYRTFVDMAPHAPDADRVRGRIEAVSTGSPAPGDRR